MNDAENLFIFWCIRKTIYLKASSATNLTKEKSLRDFRERKESYRLECKALGN